ncbi:MAG: class I SAM-dependent methyltransferase [Gammaproteobacteria bacterium]|nr:class I SAM-dependent methyltransferase [Gammaproteobacteria bacterium]
MESQTSKLACTGERVIEDDYKSSASRYLIYLFHIATYNFCTPYIRNKRVLEFGSGSGYGTFLIAPECRHIIGIDISVDAINYAKSRYQRDNLEYRNIDDINTTDLPFTDNEFDTVISFQVVEHIRNSDRFLSEIQRVLKPGGTLVIATPDRSTRLYPGQKPWNIFHITEYDPATFLRMMSRSFPETTLYGMTARGSVVDIETRRTEKLRKAAYPFTFPFCPEWYRQMSLGLLKKIQSFLPRAGHAETDSETRFGFSLDDIVIDKDAAPSVNIVSVSINPPSKT